MNAMRKKLNTGASVVIVVLMLTMLFLPLSSAAPIQPFERSGTTTANATVTAWIDGVQYGSTTANASGNFVIDVTGDDVDTTDVKDGGINGDIIIYMINGQFAAETDVYQAGSIVTGDLSAASTQPAMLKISKIITQPNDGNSNQYLYIYNPTGSAVDLSDYQLEKDDGSYVSSVHALSGTIAAGDFAYVELTSNYFSTSGDEVKLNFTTTGVIVDRVEFGSQSAVPDNTVMGDAAAPGSGEEIYRTPNPDTDTDDCSADFATQTATDRTAPSVSITSPSDGDWFASSTVTVSWTGSDGESGIDHYEVRIDGGSWTSVGTDTSHDFTSLSDGSHTVDVKALNGARLESTDTVSFNVDTTDPAVSITSPADGTVFNTDSVTVQWTGSDSGSGLDHYNYRIDGGSWSADSGDTSHDFTGLSDGSHTVDVQATDGVGNTNTDSVTFTVDTTAPSVSITSPADGALLNTATVTVEWTGSDGTSGIDHYNYRIDGGSWSADTTATSHDFTGLSDGSHTVDVQATDGAGNTNSDSVTFTVDTTAPTVTSTTPADSDTGVSVGANVVVVFSETMDTSVNPTLTQTSGTTVSYTAVGWTDNHTFEWSHADWANDEDIGLTVDGAQDVAGNAQTSYSWTFHTASGAGTATVATGLWVEKNASANNIILHWTDTGSTQWRIYGGQDKFDVTNSSNLLATVDGPADSWVHSGAYGDGLTWYYIVRGYDGVSVESTNSTMGFKQLYTFTYDSSRANINWISIPLNVSYYSSASAIVTDIEGGTGSGTNTKIQQVGLWDASGQKVTIYGYKAAPFKKWIGSNFNTYPGCGINFNIVANFTWIVNGTDTNDAITFTFDSSRANINWISVPITSTYLKASDIVTDIEGGTGSGTNTKIQQVGLWDASGQKVTIYGYKAAPFKKWIGSNFDVTAGCGVNFNIVSNFTWSPQLITPVVS